MKRIIFLIVCAFTSFGAFAWHKAELYYTDGSVIKSEIQLPDETFSGIFSRSILVKSGDDENYLSINKLNKLVLSNGVTFVKYENNGHPILLKQVTNYPNVNILILETTNSPGLVETDHYVYRSNGATAFENMPGYDIVNNSPTALNNPSINNYSYTPVGLYYSAITHNGNLYTPRATDYIYLMKGDKITRLLSTSTYANLEKVLGDNDKITKYIKNGIASYTQLNALVALYNAGDLIK